MEGHDWQVLNEPDSGRGQGWGGTLEDYLLFTQYTNDAIQTVYNLPALQGKTFRLYAPVAKSMNTWVAESLRLNATMIDRIDWHNYSTSHYDNAVQARAWSAQYSPSAGSDNTRLSLLRTCPKYTRPILSLLTFPYRDFSEYACGLADDTP